MKAITRKQYGNADVLSIEEIPTPIPKETEVLIRVHHATLNRTDCGVITGKPLVFRLFIGFKPSLVPGCDYAGEVVSVGTRVTKYKPGDRVWGLNDQGLGSYAAYMTMAEDKFIALIPDNISFQDAVACAEGGHYAINFINKVKLKSGDKVLVNGATGGIGIMAIQILKASGVYVTAVGNTKNIALLNSLGADKTYDYEKEDFTKVDQERYAFIFDAVGKSSFGRCKHLLAADGIYISSELGPNAENLYLPVLTRFTKGRRVIFPIPSKCMRSIAMLGQLLQEGEIRPVIDRHYAPEQVYEAFNYVKSGKKMGSVVLDFNVWR